MNEVMATFGILSLLREQPRPQTLTQLVILNRKHIHSASPRTPGIPHMRHHIPRVLPPSSVTPQPASSSSLHLMLPPISTAPGSYHHPQQHYAYGHHAHDRRYNAVGDYASSSRTYGNSAPLSSGGGSGTGSPVSFPTAYMDTHPAAATGVPALHHYYASHHMSSHWHEYESVNGECNLPGTTPVSAPPYTLALPNTDVPTSQCTDTLVSQLIDVLTH